LFYRGKGCTFAAVMTKQTAHGARIRPILFSTAMVQAILEGRKTQTRRVVKVQPKDSRAWELTRLLDTTNKEKKKHTGKLQWCVRNNQHSISEFDDRFFDCPYGQPGDILWVRESWTHTYQLGLNFEDENYGFVYKADWQDWEQYEGWKWKPSIHMPFAAARIFLRIKSVRVERLQDITRSDIRAEGLVCPQELRGDDTYPNYRQWYPAAWKSLWQSINGPESWDANPWVWVLEFERVSREEAGL
jgi:hypothetical protein